MTMFHLNGIIDLSSSSSSSLLLLLLSYFFNLIFYHYYFLQKLHLKHWNDLPSSGKEAFTLLYSGCRK